jgi:hypothetical protein
LPSCSRKPRLESVQQSINNHPRKKFYEEYLIDIPLLFYEENSLETCNENEQCTIFSYLTSYSLEKTYHFYQSEMERLGWQEIMCGTDCEQIQESHCCTLLYEKPRKMCVITMSYKKWKPEIIRVKIVSGLNQLKSAL